MCGSGTHVKERVQSMNEESKIRHAERDSILIQHCEMSRGDFLADTASTLNVSCYWNTTGVVGVLTSYHIVADFLGRITIMNNTR